MIGFPNNQTGQGTLHYGTVTPGVGNQINAQVPAGEIWRFNYFEFLLVTSGVGGNRQVRLLATNEGLTTFTLDTNFIQTASQTVRYGFMQGYQEYTISTGNKPAGSQIYNWPNGGFTFDGDAGGAFNGITSNTAL